MTLLKSTGLAFFVIVAPAPAQEKMAAPMQFSKQYDACMDASGGVTVEIRDCIAAEIAHWDKRLNAAYLAIMASDGHSSATKTLLRDAQRRGLRFETKDVWLTVI